MIFFIGQVVRGIGDYFGAKEQAGAVKKAAKLSLKETELETAAAEKIAELQLQNEREAREFAASQNEAAGKTAESVAAMQAQAAAAQASGTPWKLILLGVGTFGLVFLFRKK